MSSKECIYENYKFVQGIVPEADGSSETAVYISGKNAAKVYILVSLSQGTSAPPVLTPVQAQDVSGTAVKALINNARILYNANTTLSDSLVVQPPALSFTPDAGVEPKMVMFEIDCADLDVNNGFDCIGFTAGASAAASIDSVLYILGGLRYQQLLTPSALVN